MDIDITGVWLRRLADAIDKEGLNARVAAGMPIGNAKTHRFTFAAKAGVNANEASFLLHKTVSEVAQGLITIVKKAIKAKPEQIRIVLFTGKAGVGELDQPLAKHEKTFEGSFAYLIQTPGIAEPPKRKPRAKKKDRS